MPLCMAFSSSCMIRKAKQMNIIYPAILLSIITLSSCSTMKKTAALSDIDGEWKIIEINGQPLQTPTGEQLPYIGFDIQSGRIYGNSGCNRIMASIDRQARPGSIEFKHMGSTMMACPNMETESKVLTALSEVRSYRKDGKDGIDLCDSSNKPVVTLRKRFYTMPAAELQGKWNVVSVYNMPIPESMENAPFLIFDIKGNKISGNAGCNRLNGKLIINENKDSISIPPFMTTRMACPGMETENNILSALSSVKTFGKLDSEHIALYSNGGTEVLVLQKNTDAK